MKKTIFMCSAMMLAAPQARAQEGEAAVEEQPTETKKSSKFSIKDSSVHESRPHNLDVVGMFDFLFFDLALGVGGSYAFPIMPDGFIPALNDQFNIEVGASFERSWWDVGVCDGSYWSLAPTAGVRWDFLLNSDWTVFMKFKPGYKIGFGESGECFGVAYTDDTKDSSYFIIDIGPGAYWHFADGMALRLDGGSRGLAAGIDIQM